VFRAIGPARLDGFSADMNAKPSRVIGRPTAHPALHLGNRFIYWFFNCRWWWFGHLFGLWNAPLKVKSMRLADNGVPRHAT